MATNMKKVVIYLPDDVHAQLVKATNDQYDNVSNFGRRLFTEWLIDNGYLEDKRPKKDDSTT